MVRRLVFVLLLFLFWLLLSGMFTPFLLMAGVGSSIAAVFLAWRMRVASGDRSERENFPRLIACVAYAPWLMREIAVAAWDVTKRILHPRLPISPTLVEFEPAQKTNAGLLIHANSITLTPGTISVEVEPGRFLVHALTQEGALSLAGSEMNRRCAELEKQ